MAERWATFDCYGTLVDWNAGIRTELGRLFGEADADQLLRRYHEIEPLVQAQPPPPSYARVMSGVLDRLADETGIRLTEEDRGALARSLPDWPVFSDVPDALSEARARGWRLVALSNSDRNLIEASLAAIGVPFEGAIVASEIGSYKPAHGHWAAFAERFAPAPGSHVHVAQSHFHDIVPAANLGIPSIWINRLAKQAEPAPTRELPTLTSLADTLDGLVPPS
jgi:2-haloacid dehalogenase